MAGMRPARKQPRKQLSDDEVDDIIALQADDDSAWDKPVQVRRARLASMSVPAELAARAAFLAKLHREKSVEDWLTRVIRERVELEEVAYNEAKREMTLRTGV